MEKALRVQKGKETLVSAREAALAAIEVAAATLRAL